MKVKARCRDCGKLVPFFGARCLQCAVTWIGAACPQCGDSFDAEQIEPGGWIVFCPAGDPSPK